MKTITKSLLITALFISPLQPVKPTEGKETEGAVIGGLGIGATALFISMLGLYKTNLSYEQRLAASIIIGIGSGGVSAYLLNKYFHKLTLQKKLDDAAKRILAIEDEWFFKNKNISLDQFYTLAVTNVGTNWPLVITEQHLADAANKLSGAKRDLESVHTATQGKSSYAKQYQHCVALEHTVTVLEKMYVSYLNYIVSHPQYASQQAAHQRHVEELRRQEHIAALHGRLDRATRDVGTLENKWFFKNRNASTGDLYTLAATNINTNWPLVIARQNLASAATELASAQERVQSVWNETHGRSSHYDQVSQRCAALAQKIIALDDLATRYLNYVVNNPYYAAQGVLYERHLEEQRRRQEEERRREHELALQRERLRHEQQERERKERAEALERKQRQEELDRIAAHNAAVLQSALQQSARPNPVHVTVNQPAAHVPYAQNPSIPYATNPTAIPYATNPSIPYAQNPTAIPYAQRPSAPYTSPAQAPIIQPSAPPMPDAPSGLSTASGLHLPADEICCICSDEYKVNDSLGILTCNHHFHQGCIAQWLGYQKNCPLCRTDGVSVARQEKISR